MHWREARNLRQLNTPEGLFDIAENSIGPDARVSDDPLIHFTLTPVRFEWSGGHFEHPLALLVAETVLVLAAPGRGWSAKIQTPQWFRYHFMRYGVGLWRGAGPHYEVRVDHEQQGRLVFVFRTPLEAEALGEYFADE